MISWGGGGVCSSKAFFLPLAWKLTVSSRIENKGISLSKRKPAPELHPQFTISRFLVKKKRQQKIKKHHHQNKTHNFKQNDCNTSGNLSLVIRQIYWWERYKQTFRYIQKAVSEIHSERNSENNLSTLLKLFLSWLCRLGLHWLKGIEQGRDRKLFY